MQLSEIFIQKKTWFFLIIMSICTTIVYLNHFDNAFHFDDSHAILNNPYVRDLKNIPSFFKDGTTSSPLPQNQTYRPIVASSIAIDYWLGNGYKPFYFHLSNFIFFLIQGLLLFLFIFKIVELSHKTKYNFYFAAGSTLFYMIHPVMAETVNYIIARSDIQSTFFVLLAFVIYQYSSIAQKYFLYLIPVILGMLSKPTAIMFGPLFLCYLLLFESNVNFIEITKQNGFIKALSSLKKVIPTFLVCFILYIFHSKMMPTSYISGGKSVFNYLITQPSVFSYYFGSLFFPIHLSADTDWLPISSVFKWQFILGVIFICILIVVAILTSKSKKLLPISFGIVWFFLALLPTSSIIPLAEVMNDHRMFFPYIGLTLALSWSVSLLFIKLTQENKTIKPIYFSIIVCFLMCIYAFGTVQRNKVWDSEESLWKDVTLKSPKNGRGLMNYGVIKMGQGKYKIAKKYFRKALKLTPNYHTLYVNLGIISTIDKDSKTAESYFKKAISHGYDYYITWYHYGDFLYKNSRKEEALANLKKAHQLAPAHMNTRFLIMQIYQDNEEWNKLESLAKSTLKLDLNNVKTKQFLHASANKIGKIEFKEHLIDKNPSAEKYLQLSIEYYQNKKYSKAIETSKKALKIKPLYADALNNICATYNAIGQYEEAIIACNKALKIKPEFQLAKNNLNYSINQKVTISKMLDTLKDDPSEKNFVNLSLFYYNSGLLNKSIEIAKKGLIVHPNSDNLYNNICATYNSLKNWKKAIEAGKKGLEINPKNQLLMNNYNYSLSQSQIN